MIDLDEIETEIDNAIRHDGGVALMQCSYVKELITRLRQAEKDAARYIDIIERCKSIVRDEAGWGREYEVSLLNDINKAMQCK